MTALIQSIDLSSAITSATEPIPISDPLECLLETTDKKKQTELSMSISINDVQADSAKPQNAATQTDSQWVTIFYSFDKKVEVRKTKYGYGLFALEFIPKGSSIWTDRTAKNPYVTEIRVTKEEIFSWPRERQEMFLCYCWQDDENLFCGNPTMEEVTKNAHNYFNHSCDPSTWFVTDSQICARRDIHPGEELTYDYAMSDTVFLTIDNCGCCSPLCRKVIHPNDYCLPELRKRYGHHFRFFILRMMDREREEFFRKLNATAQSSVSSSPSTSSSSLSSSSASSSSSYSASSTSTSTGSHYTGPIMLEPPSPTVVSLSSFSSDPSSPTSSSLTRPPFSSSPSFSSVSSSFFPPPPPITSPLSLTSSSSSSCGSRGSGSCNSNSNSGSCIPLRRSNTNSSDSDSDSSETSDTSDASSSDSSPSSPYSDSFSTSFPLLPSSSSHPYHNSISISTFPSVLSSTDSSSDAPSIQSSVSGFQQLSLTNPLPISSSSASSSTSALSIVLTPPSPILFSSPSTSPPPCSPPIRIRDDQSILSSSLPSNVGIKFTPQNTNDSLVSLSSSSSFHTSYSTPNLSSSHLSQQHSPSSFDSDSDSDNETHNKNRPFSPPPPLSSTSSSLSLITYLTTTDGSRDIDCCEAEPERDHTRAEENLYRSLLESKKAEKKADKDDYSDSLGRGTHFSVHKYVTVRPSKIDGRGIIAQQFMPKGTLVWDDNNEDEEGYIESLSPEKDLPPENKHLLKFFYQIREGVFTGPACDETVNRDVSHFFNHSCQPNAIVIAHQMILTSDVKAGDEITINYSTLMFPPYLPITECNCLSPNCAGYINFLTSYLHKPNNSNNYLHDSSTKTHTIHSEYENSNNEEHQLWKKEIETDNKEPFREKNTENNYFNEAWDSSVALPFQLSQLQETNISLVNLKNGNDIQFKQNRILDGFER